MQYANLQPLKILDETVDDNDGEDQQRDKEEDDDTEGPALTPVKEEFVTRDLRSYFLGKSKIFDEPDGLPIIWLEVQKPRERGVIVMKNKVSRKVNV